MVVQTPPHAEPPTDTVPAVSQADPPPGLAILQMVAEYTTSSLFLHVGEWGSQSFLWTDRVRLTNWPRPYT